jgi:hypothetical protein
LGDYGALFLVDSRYASRKSQLARWLRDSFVVHNSFGEMAAALHTFFEEKVPQKLKDQARDAARKRNSGGGGAPVSSSESSSVVFISPPEVAASAPAAMVAASAPAVAASAPAVAASAPAVAGIQLPDTAAGAASDPMDVD